MFVVEGVAVFLEVLASCVFGVERRAEVCVLEVLLERGSGGGSDGLVFFWWSMGWREWWSAGCVGEMKMECSWRCSRERE